MIKIINNLQKLCNNKKCKKIDQKLQKNFEKKMKKDLKYGKKFLKISFSSTLIRIDIVWIFLFFAEKKNYKIKYNFFLSSITKSHKE